MNPQHLNLDIIDTFRDSNIRYTIRNIKQCFGFIRNEHGNIERISTRVLLKETAATIMLNFDRRTTFLDQKKCITHFSTTKIDWLNNRISELGFNYLLSPEGVDIDEFDRNMKRIIDYYSNPANYRDYTSSELLFGKYFSRQRQQDLTSKFVTDKLFGLFCLRFGRDTANGKVYQQIQMKISLYDPEKICPNILGNIMLPEDIIREYDIMFMRGVHGDYCAVCDRTLSRGGVNFRHLNSKEHLSKIK